VSTPSCRKACEQPCFQWADHPGTKCPWELEVSSFTVFTQLKDPLPSFLLHSPYLHDTSDAVCNEFKTIWNQGMQIQGKLQGGASPSDGKCPFGESVIFNENGMFVPLLLEIPKNAPRTVSDRVGSLFYFRLAHRPFNGWHTMKLKC
jgi:hypothetical protein